jgi:hypothetical protein
MGFTKVPVTLWNNTPTFTEMIAGSVAIRVGSSNDQKMEGQSKPILDTIQPEVGWFMYKIKGQDEIQSSP